MSASFQVLKRSDVLENNRQFTLAMKQGFFYLEIPEEIQPLIQHGVDFGNRFYQDQAIQNVSLGGFNGYHVREGVQVESFYLEGKYWSEIYTPELADLAKRMEILTIEILCGVLRAINIDPQDWETATGGVSSGQGLSHFSFNHYRPGVSGSGLKPHRDFGHITLLFINQKGLQARVEDHWQNVEPKDGCFVVNFGSALEVLGNNTNQLKAAVHRVQRVAQDRISFGIFLDSKMESSLYKATSQGHLEKLNMSYAQFIEEQFKITYDVSSGEFDVNVS